jgi:hypothetical protein
MNFTHSIGDQKYLDAWPDRYAPTHILQHPGAGIAPWNYVQYSLERFADGAMSVDGAPLIFYHFHQFQLLDNDKFDWLSAFYTSKCLEPSDVYGAYDGSLKAAVVETPRVKPGFFAGMKPAAEVASRRLAHRFVPRPVKEILRRLLLI